MSAATPLSPTKDRVPPVVMLLAAVIFAFGTSEFMIAGLLENIAGELHVSLSAAGLLVTGFAVGMTIGAPAMAIATLRLPIRTTMIGATAIFALAHVMGAMAPDYAILMTSRVIAAVACGAFWAVAAVHTARVAPPAVVARSLAALIGGLSLANVIGVPGGAWLGTLFGWRSAFWALAAISALAAVLLARAVKVKPEPNKKPIGALLRAELKAFRGPRLWISLSVTAAFQAAVFAAFSYFGPLLTQVSGVPSQWVPAVLMGFGVGAFLGVTIGGRLADRNLFGNMIGSLIALSLSLVLLALVASVAWAAIVAIVLVGLSGFSIAGALNARVFQVAGAAPTLASSVNTSAFNVGNAVGPALGAAVLAAGAPPTATVWVGAGLAVLALGLALVAKFSDGPLLRAQEARELAG